MKEIRLERVSRHFGRHFALHRVDLTIPAGAITAIVGANGAGKTTLLNILATLDRPTAGQVLYENLTWSHVAKRGRALIGWVSHEPLVYPDLTGRENLDFYASMYQVDTGRIDTLLARVGLTQAASRRVDAYSRGMVQRLTIARALLHEPRLLLLDEPLTGLDRDGRADIVELFKELRDDGRIVVVTTHDLHSLGDMCDHLVVLRRGQVAHEHRPTSTREVIAAYEEYA